jgi:hypothetical protein
MALQTVAFANRNLNACTAVNPSLRHNVWREEGFGFCGPCIREVQSLWLVRYNGSFAPSSKILLSTPRAQHDRF